MRFPILLITLFFWVYPKAQPGEPQIQFSFSLAHQPLEIGRKYYLSGNQDSVKIETIKFYLSNLQFFRNGHLVSTYEHKHLLIDAENRESWQLALPSDAALKFDSLTFNIGVDSLTSVSGAYGGDLDPSKGMYWTWQSGYINFKLEGIADRCPAREHRFQFHIGGYQEPFNMLQKVGLKIETPKNIEINLDIAQLLAQINLEENFQVMSPNQKALEFTQLLPSIFSIKK